MSRKPYLVGIVGGSASGKTSFQRDLAARLPAGQCALVSQDNYYRMLAEQCCDDAGFANFDLPTSIHRDRLLADLQMLERGESVTGKEFTYNQPDKPGKGFVIAPAPVVIVEGLFLFYCEEIRARFDLRIFIEAPVEVCRERRLDRDVRERGLLLAHVEYQWENHVVPAYRQFVLPFRDHAHLVVTNHDGYEEGLESVLQHVLRSVEAQG
jgi:uridine kinase